MLKDKSSEKLNLSFDFQLLNFEWRKPEVKIKGMIREIKYSTEFFEWFMEDLIYFLDRNGIKTRWDIVEIILFGIDNLGLNEQELSSFRKELKTVISWNMKEG